MSDGKTFAEQNGKSSRKFLLNRDRNSYSEKAEVNQKQNVEEAEEEIRRK